MMHGSINIIHHTIDETFSIEMAAVEQGHTNVALANRALMGVVFISLFATICHVASTIISWAGYVSAASPNSVSTDVCYPADMFSLSLLLPDQPREALLLPAACQNSN